MMEYLTYNHAFIVVFALLGSAKSNIFVKEPWYEKVLDLILGLSVGVAMAEYVHLNNGSEEGGFIWLGCMIAMTGGLLGSNIIEAIMSLKPKDLRELLIKWLSK